MSDARPTIKATDLVSVIRLLPPTMSSLIIGPHGVGKSEIAQQIAEHFNLELIDRRLSQMTEGDMIGLPDKSDDITRFLPVDWFKLGCEKPCLMLLDEFNRAQPEIMNAAFQIVYDRELNGLKLHPETRIICCVNAGANYAVNEMDAALINRFAVFNFEPDLEDWMLWAKGPRGNIDPIIIDFIRNNPKELRMKDIGAQEPMTAYPTPRGWAHAHACLKNGNMAPADVCGNAPPGAFFHMVASIVGHPTAVSFTKFVRDYAKVVTAEDILDNWDEKASMVKTLTHDAVVGIIEKIGDHCAKNKWTKTNVENLEKFADAMCNGEDWLSLFSIVTKSKDIANIKMFHASGITKRILENVEAATAAKDK